MASCSPRLAHTGLLAVAACALAACGEQTQFFPPPGDRFFYPTGLAIRHPTAAAAGAPCAAGAGTAVGCPTQLFVASSNADLRYEPASGGTLASIDVDRAIGQSVDGAPHASAPPAPTFPTSQSLVPENGLLGVATIGSLAGEVTVLDEATCPGWTAASGGKGPQVLVPTRGQGLLHRVGLDDAGVLTCTDGCAVPVTTFSNFSALQVKDPWQVILACGSFPPDAGGAPTPRVLGFATYLNVEAGLGALGELDLAQASPAPVLRSMGVSPTRGGLFDPASTRLFASQGFASIGVSPLRWLTLASPESGYGSHNFAGTLGPAVVRNVALSTDRTKLYLGLGLYDPQLAVSNAVLPVFDVGAALAVADLAETSSGDPTLHVLDLADRYIGRGIAEIAVVPGPHGDLVAVTSVEDASLALYDTATGDVVNVFGYCQLAAGDNKHAPSPCPFGAPLLGKQPFGLVAEPLAPAADPDGQGRSLARLYVGSFDRGWVNVITIDPANPGADPVQWVRIGPERP